MKRSDSAVPKSRLAAPLRAAVVVNMLIVAFSTATGGLSADLLQLYASQTLGFTAAQIGLALAFLMVSIPFQLASPRLARRLGYRNTMRVGYSCALVLLAGLAALPSIQSPSARYVAFIVVIVLIEIAISCSWGNVWHAWMQRIVARDERPRLLTAMRTAAQTFNLVLTAGFALFVGAAVSAGEYRMLLAVLAVALVTSIVLLRAVPSPSVSEPETRGGVLRTFRESLTRPGERSLYALMLIELIVLIPVMPLFTTQVLGVPAEVAAATIVVRGLVGIPATALWGRLLRGRGAVAVLRAAACITALSGVAYAVLCTQADGERAATGVVVAVVLLAVVSGIAGSGWALASMNLWYAHVVEASAIETFTMQDVLNSGRVQLSFLVAGTALSLLGSVTVHVGKVGVNAFAGWFLLSLLGAVAVWAVTRSLVSSEGGAV
jgi:hypothetical protein